MLSLTVNTPTQLLFSTPFLPNHHLYPPQPPQNPQRSPTSLVVSAFILPRSSTSSLPSQKQQLYQPFRPPPSPLPSQYRKLDTGAHLEILANRLGSWFEYAPLITSLIQQGFTSSTLEELTGIPSVEQNQLVVAAQVRDSLVQFAGDGQTVSYFDTPEILYEIRILNSTQRVAAARSIIANGFDAKKAEELARSIKDFPRRHGDRGWDYFDGNSPGDCLAFMYFRRAQEHKSTCDLELSKAALRRALEVAETNKAKQRVEEDLEKEGDIDDDLVRVPVVRMAIREVGESSVIVVLPVCSKESEVEEAPWEVGLGGEFGVVQAEKRWSRWVVLPGWGPVAVLKRGGVAVAFPKAMGVLSFMGERREDGDDEEILVVADRGRKDVEFDDGFYLVVGGEEEGLRVERGSKLKDIGVAVSLGTVVLVVRPSKEER